MRTLSTTRASPEPGTPQDDTKARMGGALGGAGFILTAVLMSYLTDLNPDLFGSPGMATAVEYVVSGIVGSVGAYLGAFWFANNPTNPPNRRAPT